MIVPYPTEREAIERTAAWATHLGCGRQPGDVTRYWYGWQTRTGDPEVDAGLPDSVDVAIVIPEGADRLDQLVREDQLTPEELTYLVEAYPPYQVGVAYPVGALFAYEGQLYEVIQAHTTQADWTPDSVPALYLRRTPEDVIPEWVQPTGSHDSYSIGDRVTFNGSVYESLINGNVWSPTAYPAGWRLVNG